MDDFHLAHLGSFAMGGAGLVFMESTGVTLDGRISPYCPTLHEDSQIASIARIAKFIQNQGAKFGMQLNHAGRKASTPPPFQGRFATLIGTPDSWQPVGPSAVPYAADWAVPHELTKTEIAEIVKAFVDSTHRAIAAGVDVLEIHGAHGYLVHQFISPISNKRTDEYGGSLENRARFLLEIVKAIRPIWSKPLFVRLSATDWVEGGVTGEETVEISKMLKQLDVDLVDVTTGGNVYAKIEVKPGYQVPFAEQVKKNAHIPTMAVGMITDAHQAEAILTEGKADLIALAREHLRHPNFAILAAAELTAAQNAAASASASTSGETAPAPLLPTYIPPYAWCIGKFKI